MALSKEMDWNEKQLPILRYKGVFDWPGLYQLVRKWIANNNYKYQEKKYKHKGDEVEVNMTGERKIDEMHRYELAFDFHIWGMKDKTVVRGGKTVQLQYGRIEININGVVTVDYSGRFGEGKIAGILGKWWFTITKREFEATLLEPLTYDLYALHADIKSFLEMTTDYNAF